ncbi:Uncharacterised protein [Mycobacteroides abscessus]|nr:Uncharacterised protein [Mycobacteroides abscessus]
MGYPPKRISGLNAEAWLIRLCWTSGAIVLLDVSARPTRQPRCFGLFRNGDGDAATRPPRAGGQPPRPDRYDGSRARPQAREAESSAGMAMPTESITYPRRHVRGGALAGIAQRDKPH